MALVQFAVLFLVLYPALCLVLCLDRLPGPVEADRFAGRRCRRRLGLGAAEMTTNLN